MKFLENLEWIDEYMNNMKKKVWKKMKNWKINLVDDGVPLDLMEMQNLLVPIFRSRSNG
jgi:hypothetical protein